MPGKPQIERKLAAIMFTDIVGYTALSAKDSTKSSELLKTQRETLKPIVEKHGGSWMKEIGDGLLLTFDSATSAVECSIAIQIATKDIEDLNLRIGIHEGEVIKQDGDVIGDDVNVASRIEPFSAIGGVAISHKIEQAISSNTEFETKYIGKPKLKGVAQEVKVYCITSHGLPQTDVSKVSAKLEEESKFNIFALTGGILTAIGVAFWVAVGVFDVSFGGKSEVPSVGILMMENRGAEEDEFWASGITQDLIVKVAGAGLIRVAPMKEILEVDIKESFREIANKLRVKYILTSSIYKKEDGFDLHCQLIEAESGNTKYANKWSEPIANAPTIVGNLTDNILKILKVSTIQNIAKAPTLNAKAYEHYLMGRNRYKKQKNNEDIAIAKELLRRAIDLDDNLIDAQIWLGRIYKYENNSKALTIFEQSLKKSRALGDSIGVAGALIGIGDVQLKLGKIDSAVTCYKQAIDIEEKIGDRRGLARLKLAFCQSELVFDSQEETINYYKQSLAIAKELEDSIEITSNLMKIGNLLRESKPDQAKDYYIEAHRIYEKLEKKVKIIISFLQIGDAYAKMEEGNKALNYYMKALRLSEESKNKNNNIMITLFTIGRYYHSKDDLDTALDYYNRSLNISVDPELNQYLFLLLDYIGVIYQSKGDLNTALNFYIRILEKDEQFWNWTIGRAQPLFRIGSIYQITGEYEKAIDYYTQSHEIYKKHGNTLWIAASMTKMGICYNEISNIESDYLNQILNQLRAVEFLEKSHALLIEIERKDILLMTTTYLYLHYKNENKGYDLDEIHKLIEETEKITFFLNYALYQLIEDTSYLESAYNQVQEKADNLEPDVAAKFLSYPIPKAIVEEWEKVK